MGRGQNHISPPSSSLCPPGRDSGHLLLHTQPPPPRFLLSLTPPPADCHILFPLLLLSTTYYYPHARNAMSFAIVARESAGQSSGGIMWDECTA